MNRKIFAALAAMTAPLQAAAQGIDDTINTVIGKSPLIRKDVLRCMTIRIMTIIVIRISSLRA